MTRRLHAPRRALLHTLLHRGLLYHGLLCALLRGAPDAHLSSTPVQVAPDAAALHALLARSGPAAEEDVQQQAVALLGGRPRAPRRPPSVRSRSGCF